MVGARKRAIHELAGEPLFAAPPAPPLSDEERALTKDMSEGEFINFMADRSEKASKDYWDAWERNRQERIQARVAEIEAEDD